MAKWLFVLAVAVVLAVSAEKTTTPEPTTLPTTTPKSTTSTTTTSTTTEKITTTPETTTTSAPNTTTTTTAVPTTPTPVPPAPAVYPYNYDNTPWFKNSTAGKDHFVCIALRGAFAIHVDNSTIAVPTNAYAYGTCIRGFSASLTLSWIRPNDTKNTSVTFYVESTNDTSAEAYRFKQVVVQLPNMSEKLVSNETLFQVQVAKSYKCTTESHVNLSNGTEFLMQKLQAEAFPKTDAESFKDFDSAEECRGDDVSAVVPVAVGAALIVLVVIVLVAYIIGRRRSRSRGYQSV